jgi:DNA helicase IV
VRARDAALGDKQVHAFHLSTNYRNSAEIYQYAAAYAERVGLGADLPNAVRSTGVSPSEIVQPDLEAATRRLVGEMVEAVAGTVGVVVPVARRSEVSGWLASWPEIASMTAGDDARVVVLTGLDTKGLEFDGIVVVEPTEIETESPAGRATLYVVYTRATQRMVTVSQGS